RPVAATGAPQRAAGAVPGCGNAGVPAAHSAAVWVVADRAGARDLNLRVSGDALRLLQLDVAREVRGPERQGRCAWARCRDGKDVVRNAGATGTGSNVGADRARAGRRAATGA